MLAMQPSVQCGSSISAIVVPYWPLSPLFSHIARPQPWSGRRRATSSVDQRLVLAVRVATLVAHEVVARPSVALRVLGGRRQRDRVEVADAPRVHRSCRAAVTMRPPGTCWNRNSSMIKHDDADDAGRRQHRPSTCCRAARRRPTCRGRSPRRARRCRPSSASAAAGRGTAAGAGSTADR